LDVETDFGLPGLVERMGASDNPNDTLSCMQALEINEDLKAKINKLKKKEREFIIEYFGLDKPLGAMTLSQKMIGEQKGLSRQRANMIIQNALKKLRKMYESEERR
jgi:DNA-directed RNA polymerase sigma subunit (sigma70/sigma32)